jgi:hypothetical protein
LRNLKRLQKSRLATTIGRNREGVRRVRLEPHLTKSVCVGGGVPISRRKGGGYPFCLRPVSEADAEGLGTTIIHEWKRIESTELWKIMTTF